MCEDYNKGRTEGRLLAVAPADLPNAVLPAGYAGFCTLASVQAASVQGDSTRRREEARSKACAAENEKAIKDTTLSPIPAGQCTDEGLTERKIEWEAPALRAACIEAGLGVGCGWHDLAQASFDQKQAKVTKDKLAALVVDAKPLLDSQVGECSYRALAALGPEWEQAAFRTMPVQPWTFTVAASLAEPQFKFIDPETLEEVTTSEDNRALSAQIGTLRRGTWWSLTYTRRTTFQAGPTRELCSPTGSGGDLLCREVRLGAPAEKKQDIGQVDVKRFVSPRLAAVGRLLYDFETDIWQPHVLLFFLQKREKEKVAGLDGGLDLAYDEENRFTARLFVGTRFDMSKP